MANQTTKKIAFPLLVTVRCHKCNAALMNTPRFTLTHARGNGCPFEGKVFKGPIVYLEEVK
jgi:hypothetical protein